MTKKSQYNLRLPASLKLQWDSMAVCRGETTSQFIRGAVEARITAEVKDAAAAIQKRTAPIINALIEEHGAYVTDYCPHQMSNVSFGGDTDVAEWVRMADPEQVSDVDLRAILSDLLEAMTEPVDA